MKKTVALFSEEATDVVKGINLHSRMRNCLLMLLAISNASRMGCLTNMTINEVLEAQTRVRDNSHIILVSDHKTEGTYGPAELVITAQNYRYMLVYKNWFRCGQDNECHFFMNWGGAKMISNTLINALTRELLNAGINKKITCTQMRHLAVTIVSAVAPGQCPSLAGLMAHSTGEQQKTYNECKKLCRSTKASNLLFKLVTEQQIEPGDFEEARYEIPGYDLSRQKIPTVVTHQSGKVPNKAVETGMAYLVIYNFKDFK